MHNFSWTMERAILLHDVTCSYGSAARKSKTYKAGTEVDLRAWYSGSFDLLDDHYYVIGTATEGIDFERKTNT